MKPIVKFLSVLSLSLFVLTGAYGVAPVITGITPDSVELNSPWPAFTPPSPYVPYQITTNTDGTAGAPILYNATGLPAGLTLDALNGEISGAPNELGTFNVILSATNGLDETGTAVLVLTVTDPLPVITSDAAISAAASSPFTYTITATNNPTSFSVIGLGALPTDSEDTTILSSTGTFTFTPSASAVGDSFNLIVTATNDAGATPQLLVVTVLPAVPQAPSVATVALISPVPSDSFTADTTSLTVAATVTPAAGATIDTVFVRWNNPPAKPDGTLRAPIILAQLTNTAGDVYEAVVDIGFDPENCEIGGGLIDLEVVAYQTNAADGDDFASDDVQFRVEPLLAVLFPDDQLARGFFDIGDIFASARVATNELSKVTARISGPGIVFSVVDDEPSENGVFNFELPQLINFAGTYSVEVVAEDLAGRTTTIVRELFLTETIESPVALVVAPSPGFTNEVFTAAIATYTEQSREIVTVQNVGVVGVNVTYGLELISGGQGYYPRNATGATILTTANTGVGQLTRGLGGVTLANGRISALPDTATIFYNVGDPEWGSFGNAVMDDLGDPGANGKIDITAQFFRALGKLKSYKLFVNGADLTPGNGNLDPDVGLVDIAVIQFPPAGQGSPDPGDYVVVAQVFDENGQVGSSSPVPFQIVPYDLPTVTIDDLPTVTIDSPADGASYTQGDSISLEITANDDDGFVTSVEIFNGATSLGTALKISGDQYRYTIDTATAEIASGTLNLSARATDNIGNSGSALLTVDLSPIVFSVSFTDPTENPLVLRSTISPIEQVFSVEIAAANAAAIESVQWYFADVLVAESAIVADTLSYTETLNLAKSGELRVKVTDAVSGISVEATVSVIVSINIETPLNSDEAFVRDAYVRLTANTPTDTYVANAVAQMDGTVDGQVAYLQSLFDSSDMVETEQLLMVYRTMTGEWPDATELAAARAGLFGGTVATAAAPGSIETGVPQQTFEFFYNAGDAVTVSVTGAGDDPLSDPTLTINSPSGVLINFDDDSGLGLNPLVNFTATEAGTYSAIVGGFSTLRGDFTISSSATNLGGSTSASLQALVISLIPEFEARFNLTFPTSSVASSTETTNLVLQLFKNKHGVNPSAQATVRLKESLTGPGSGPWPGYSGNLTTFTEAFVLDNSRSHINQGYSSVHYYEIPNQPFGDVPLALMIAMFLDEDPSNQALAAYDGMAQVFESILTDPSYYEQFPPTGVENFVNSALADLGVFDQSFNGPADDADGDGVSNLMEIALGSAPTDLSDTIEPMESATDGTDLVITFIRIKASEVPRDFIISLECSEDLIVWNTAADTAAVASPVADQSGVAEGYERAEIRIDMIAQACGFFRLSVDLP